MSLRHFRLDNQLQSHSELPGGGVVGLQVLNLRPDSRNSKPERPSLICFTLRFELPDAGVVGVLVGPYTVSTQHSTPHTQHSTVSTDTPGSSFFIAGLNAEVSNREWLHSCLCSLHMFRESICWNRTFRNDRTLRIFLLLRVRLAD